MKRVLRMAGSLVLWVCPLFALTPGTLSRETLASDIAIAKKLPHPRLFADTEDFEALKKRIREEGLARESFQKILFLSEGIIGQPLLERRKIGRRLLSVSREALRRITTLSMAFRVSGERRYLLRCVEEMKRLCSFEDWNPSHFLDVAEMTLAVSIGYDWLYNEMESCPREEIARGLLEKGILPAAQSRGWWRKASNNWGQVCRCGIIAGAVALMDREESLALDLILESVHALPRPMRVYRPHGAYPEGPGYWNYGTSFNAMAIAILEKCFKRAYGLAEMEGFQESADFMDRVTGPSGLTFNYADGGSRRDPAAILWWFARRFRKPGILSYCEEELYRRWIADRSDERGERLFPLTLLWLRPVPSSIRPIIPLTWSSGGEVPITVQRSGLGKYALFVGLKGGSPSHAHGQMDGGSFVLDACGVRWAIDLGAENYHKIESRGLSLWNFSQNSDRWRIFRLNSYGHNILMIGDRQQRVKGSAKVISVKEGIPSEVVMDLSSLYPSARKVARTGTLLQDGRYRLADTLEGVLPGTEVRWAMNTHARARVSGRDLILSQKEKSLRLSTRSPGSWRVREDQPVQSWDSPNKGCRQILFTSQVPAS